MYVYLIKNSEDSTYKIGVGKSPTQRLKQLQTGNPSELILINTYFTEFAHKIEKALHKKYGHFKKSGEWFDFSIKEELNFINNCKETEKNIKILIENENPFI